MDSFYDSNNEQWGSLNGTFSHDRYYQQDDENIFLRFLKDDSKAKDIVRVDYSVLSVGVMTLGLILVVEVLRHKIDHAALHRPFCKAVLEGVYSERTYA